MIARNKNELWGRVLMDELGRSGVQHVIVSPGSRSAPLVLAAATEAGIRTTVQIDERSAGYLALGVGKATGRPAVVVTTSGTAVANLLPAVVEASQSECPLLLLTADRPSRLRGTDANQTIDQTGILGGYLRLFHEAAADTVSETSLRSTRSLVCRAVGAALGSPAGPVHLNLPFEKPLEPSPVPDDLPPELARGDTLGSAGRPGGRPWTTVSRGSASPTAEDVAWTVREIRASRAPMIVAGVTPRPWELGPVLGDVASALGIPLLADALSGARFAPGGAEGSELVVGGYDVALRDDGIAEALRPDLLIRIGASPTSAVLNDWLASLDGIAQILIDEGGRWKDHASTATRWIRADPVRFVEALLDDALTGDGAAPGPPASGPTGVLWSAVEREVRSCLEAPADRAPFDGRALSDLVRRLPPDEIVFVSGSLPVRDLDTFVPSREAPLTVLGNRGASGIDGIVSSAAGASLATGRRVTALVGDIALLHDANGLSVLREAGVEVLVVVWNNDGGGIFHLLPIRDYEPEFTKYFATPHGRDFELLAGFHDLPYHRVDLRSRTDSAEGSLSEPNTDGDEAGTGSATLRAGGGDLRALEEALELALVREGSGILEVRTDRRRNLEAREDFIGEIILSVRKSLSDGGDRPPGSEARPAMSEAQSSPSETRSTRVE